MTQLYYFVAEALKANPRLAFVAQRSSGIHRCRSPDCGSDAGLLRRRLRLPPPLLLSAGHKSVTNEKKASC